MKDVRSQAYILVFLSGPAETTYMGLADKNFTQVCGALFLPVSLSDLVSEFSFDMHHF